MEIFQGFSLLELIIVTIPQSIIIILIGSLLINVKVTFYKIVVISMATAVVWYLIIFFKVPYLAHTIILLLSLILQLHFICRINYVPSILISVTGFVVFMIMEMVIGNLTLPLYGFTVQDLHNSSYNRAVAFVPILITSTAVIALIKYLKISIIGDFKRKNIKYYPVLFFMMVPLFLTSIAYFLLYINSSRHILDAYGNYVSLLYLLVGLILAILFILSFNIIKKVLRAMEEEYESKKNKMILEKMEGLLLNIRRQRHDFNHHLQVMYGLLHIGKYDNAKNYINNLCSKIHSSNQLIKTENFEIGALLYGKLGLAESQNICFNLEIPNSLKSCPVITEDLVSILGNLIDNAIEAAGKDNGQIILRIFSNIDYFKIDIQNTGKVIEKEIAEKIFEKNFSTKESEGIGLYIVKTIVDKYAGIIKFESKEEKTSFHITIPVTA